MLHHRSKIAISLAWILFWVLMTVVAVQDYQRDVAMDGLWRPVLWETSSAFTITLLTFVHVRCTRNDRHLGKPWRWFALEALWLPMYWLAFVPIAFGIRHAVYSLAGEAYTHEAWPRVLVYESLKLTVFLSLFIVIRFGILSYRALLDAKLRAEQSAALLQQAQLQHLTQQMQPHFLFNALNTVSSTMHVDVARADAMLVQLSEFLRTALHNGERHETPLESELRLARGYADIMAARFADRVNMDWQVDEAVLSCPVPVMSLQPLLENVFKHTVERRRERTHIEVQARLSGGELVIAVRDDKGLLSPGSQPGIGLTNLRARLAALYGGRANLTLSQLAPAGVHAEMRLPCAS